jgi:serine/threonine-protein kinase
MDAAAPRPPDALFLQFQEAVAGRYSLERELGRGGMGVVYLAREVRLDRPVAIKLLPPRLARDPALRERFLREARTAAKLSHPHIVPIHAVDEAREFVFFAMAYVDGETLTDRVRRRGPVSPPEATRILREVAWALGYAHAQGVVHRDVKPDNILLEAGTGRALVADFGIAAIVREASGVDGGPVAGTPEFMSPEQALGETVDGRSDLYALGAVGYFAVSARFPFHAATPTEVLAKQITEAPQPLAAVADGVPRRLGQVIEQCLEKERDARPESAAAVADRLGVALEQRRELPVALRVFVKRGSRLSGAGTALYLAFGLPFLLFVAFGLAPPGLEGTFVFTAFVKGLTIVPFAVLVWRARRLLASGFDHQDLGPAFRRELEQGHEERLFEYGRTRPLLERIMGALTALSAAGGAVSALILGLFPSSWTSVGSWLSPLFAISMFGLGVCGLSWVYLLNRRVDLDTRIWSWLWTGRVGKLLFRLARLLVPARALPAAATHRATELALGLAAEKLFDQLPRETRRHLRDLPATVHRLEADAQRMRTRLEQLNDAIGFDGREGDGGRGTGDGAARDRRDAMLADLRAERDAVQRRLGDVVAALEAIRLNLLKLHAGSSTVQSLTTDLGLAREVSQEIDRVLAAGGEVEAALRPTPP